VIVAYLEKKASESLANALVTCGGVNGPFYLVARQIASSGGGELGFILKGELGIVADATISKLRYYAQNGHITPNSVLSRYGFPQHFHEMNEEAQKGMNSVAREVPAEYRAVAHTLLPIRNGVYSNEGRIISFKGLVPLGPQTGNLVAHLGGIFSSGCSDAEINALLAAQAEDVDFLKMADKVGTLDYDGTRLQRDTLAAKKEMRL
jgi:hypothetical protein